ncbi:MAG: 4Fe-4S binding protein [Euryarchaeota archaeon]|nr:4Fe-4S binding protein [Euryarchaeota archaeon]
MAKKKISVGGVNPVAGSSKNYKTGTWRSMRPVLHPEHCIGCWTCYRYCPDSSIIRITDGKKRIEINLDYCKGCGICAYECPQNKKADKEKTDKKAITMVTEEK